MKDTKRNSMPRQHIDFDTVRKLALQLPEVEDASAYGSPALRVRGQLLACIAINKSAEPGSLAVRVDFDRRAELLEAAPEIYYITDHYLNYPSVLVRLSRIREDALLDLLKMSWQFVAAQHGKTRRTTRKRSPRRG